MIYQPLTPHYMYIAECTIDAMIDALKPMPWTIQDELNRAAAEEAGEHEHGDSSYYTDSRHSDLDCDSCGCTAIPQSHDHCPICGAGLSDPNNWLANVAKRNHTTVQSYRNH